MKNNGSHLFEAVKETLTGDHGEGRYARRVMGEGVEELEEGSRPHGKISRALRENIPRQAEEISRLSSSIGKIARRIHDDDLLDYMSAQDKKVIMNLWSSLATCLRRITTIRGEFNDRGLDAANKKRRQ